MGTLTGFRVREIGQFGVDAEFFEIPPGGIVAEFKDGSKVIVPGNRPRAEAQRSFTRKTAAAFVGCKQNAIAEAIRKKELDAKLVGKTYVIRATDLTSWLNSQPSVGTLPPKTRTRKNRATKPATV